MKRARFLRAAVLLLVLGTLCGCSGGSSPAYVKGEPISPEEIAFFEQRSRSDIVNLFAEKYAIEDFSDFWQTEFEGTTPEQALRELALEKARQAKERLIEMREAGIYDDISFEGLKKRAEAYNESRENGSPQVGLDRIDMDSFYIYYIENGEMLLEDLQGADEASFGLENTQPQ